MVVGVEPITPWSSQKIGRAQEHRGPLFPRAAQTSRGSCLGGCDRRLDLGGAASVQRTQDVAMMMRRNDGAGATGPQPLSADVKRHLDGLS